MKRIVLVLLGLCAVFLCPAQNWTVEWESSAHVMGGTGDYLPLWQRTGNNGILPNTSSSTLTLGADLKYRSPKGWFFETGANVAGSLAMKNKYNPFWTTGLVDRLYISGGWKMLRLDVGMLPYEREFGELSLSGGNFMWSGNARNIPGINFKMDWLYFEKGHWFGIKANYGHYQFIDNRSTKGTMLHDKSLAIKVACGKKVDLILGLEHMAQWGGIAPDGTKKPSSFKDYVKIVLAQGGGSNASMSDQINVLGNHLGHEYLRVNWRARPFTMTFQYDKPFEDGSGTRFQNIPDGLWTLSLKFNDRNAAVTDLLFEFLTTTWQSGPEHDVPIPAEELLNPIPGQSYRDGRKILGGCDNYFDNVEYRSGWTNYGRTIGMPLIIPSLPNEKGVVVGIPNTRVRGYHFGLSGNAAKGVTYTLKSTFTRNYGIYHQSPSSFFASKPWQLSLGLEFRFDNMRTVLPVTFAIGAYGDIGKLYQNGVGITFRILYNGSKRF